MTNKKILTLISLLLVSFLMVGCMLPKLNLPPGITSDPVEKATVGIEYVYGVEATDPNPKDVLTYSLTENPEDMLIDEDSGVITWTPNTVGEFDVTVVVLDKKGLSDTQIFTITVTPVPVAPTLTAIANQIAYYGEVFTYTVIAIAGTGPDLTFSLPVAPTMMSIDSATGVISWTPIAAQLGYHNVTVKVTANDGLSDEASFIVEVREQVPPEVKLTSIVVLPETMTLFVGESRPVTSVTAHYDDGSSAVVALVGCTYTSSATGIATVSNGVVTAVAKGTATITVTYKGKTDTLGVTVKEHELGLTSIAVAPKAMTLFVGESGAIKSVTATYEIKGYDIPIALGDCTYTSSATTVATVSDAGLVSGVAEGEATITVSYGGKSDTLEVTVNPVLLTSIVVLPEAMTLSVRGSGTITSVTANYNDGSTPNVLGDCTFTSDDEAVATVSAGVVSALTPGTATITVTYGDMTDTVEVTVNSILLTSIVIDPKTMNIYKGESEDIKSVTAHYSDGTNKIVTSDPDCIYDSSDSGIASVSAGTVTAEAYGEATITVSYTEEEITKTVSIEETDTLEVTVIGPVHNINANRYYETITKALDDAAVGDTIEVAAGTYDEDVTIGIIGVTLQAGTKHEAIIEGTVVITAYNVTVDGFYIKNFSQIPSIPILYWPAIYMPSGTDILVVNNLIDGTGIDPVANLTVGTLSGGTAEATLEGNTIRNVNMGICSQGASSLLISNNNIEDAAHCGIGIDTSAGTLITGNTISNCDEGIDVYGANVVANFNNITGNIKFGIWTNKIQVDATNNWWDDASGPYHPTANSSGLGDAVSDNVDFSDWNDSPY